MERGVYAVMMMVAVGAGCWLSRRRQAGLPLDAVQRIGLAVGAFCGAMIGAKLPFALADWPGLASGAAWFSDGKTIMTGIVGGYFGVELAKWSLDIRVKTGDTFAVPVAVAVGIGRLACFAVGCCYGAPTSLPWGMTFATAGDGVRRHPTQLYECAFHLGMAVVLEGLARCGIWRGQLIKAYILAYMGYRFLTEWIRPEPVLGWGLTGYQWFALAVSPLFVWLWWSDTRPADYRSES